MTKHSAPPVVYPIGRSAFQFWLLFGLWLSGLGLLTIWFAGTSRLDWRMASGCAAVLVGGLPLYGTWRNALRGQIGWDGEIWHWQSAEDGVESSQQSLSVVADFQKRLIVMLESETGARSWFCAERMACPERWLDFRRAIYCPGKASPLRSWRKPSPDRAVAVAVSSHAGAPHSIHTGS
ncbi:hypothetical protein [Polaromonas sp.]|uniref:hypothetical protein n=1 Tax=Polaromonas sp. TaxID=1869339 RepID=UPI002D002839|nr:hypothetical protein [Polaromonas sp.]HQS30479.1 hypothetical protein [Polaromonas sp.]HQS89758.1 hypothetical protein [Polaromonas sp.]